MTSFKTLSIKLQQLENFLLFLLVISMLGLSVTQIFLRNFFDYGIVWAETSTRLLVFLTTMIASMVAARSLQHIRIDLIERYGSDNIKKIIPSLIHLLTALLCLFLVYFSSQFLMFEFEDGTEAFANIPNWVFITIMPVSFAVMALRYLLHAINHFLQVNEPR